MTFRTVWSQTNLSVDPSPTTNHYEEESLSATISAVYQDYTPGVELEPDVVNSSQNCFITLSSDFSQYGLTVSQPYSTIGTATGIITNVFTRKLDFLIDNLDPKARTYGSVNSVSLLPVEKLMLYGYSKEQTPEKTVYVTATAYIRSNNLFVAVDTKQFGLTCINVFNDSSVIKGIIADHNEFI